MKKGKLSRLLLAVATAAFAAALAVPALAFAANGTIEGDGTESSPYLIEDVDDLKAFRNNVNAGDSYEGKYIQLDVDINLNQEEWTPIGNKDNQFKGYFDGNEKTITGLKVSNPSANYAGLFGYVKGSGMTSTTKPSVKDLKLAEVSVVGNYYVGGLAGQAYTCNISNVDVQGTVSGVRYVGGLAGHVYTYFSECSFSGDASCSFDALGGIAGAGDCRAYGCSVIGKVTGDNWVGGIMGNGQEGSSAVGCYVKATVSTSSNYYRGVGGIAGVAGHGYSASEFKNNYFDGEVYLCGEKIPAMVMGLVNADSNETIGTSVEGNSWNTEFYPADTPVYVVAEITKDGDLDDWVTSAAEDLTDSRNNNLVMLESDIQYVDADDMGDVTIMDFSDITSVDPDLTAKVNDNRNVAFVDANGNGAWDDGESKYLELSGAISVGGDIVMLRNVTLTEALEIADGAIVSLDLNEKTLNGSVLAPNAALAIKNGSIVNTNSAVSAIEINAGELTLIDVSIDSARHAVRIDGAVEATIDSGTYRGAIGTGAGTYHAVNVSGAANVTIKGGTFVGPKGTTADSGSAVNVQAGAKVSIEGGSFSGGKNSTLASNGTLTVSGGTFDQDPASYVVDGYVSMHDSDTGMYAVVEAVAEVGGVQYGTLESALKALTESNSTLTLLQDVAFDGTWDCRSNGAKITAPVTIDGSGHTLKLTGTTDDRNWETVFRFEGESATVKNLTIDASGVENIKRGITAKQSIVVENCTLIGNGTTAWLAVIYGEGAGNAISGVTASVTGSKFIDWDYGVSDNQNGQDAELVSITDSDFENAGVLVSASDEVVFTGNTVEGAGVNISSYSATNELVVTATDNELDSAAENEITASEIIAQDGFATPVAQVGGKLYTSLTKAISEAARAEGKTVKLLADVTVSESVDASDVVLDQNGKAITLAAGASLKSTSELTVKAASGHYIATEGNAEAGYIYTSKPIPYIPPADEPECGEDAACNAFNDVDVDAWYHEAIDWAVENGILRGYDDGSGNVGPEDVTLRAHVMVMLHRMAGEPGPSADAAFGDVRAGAWYSDAVAWAAEAGLTTGYTDGSGLFGTGDAMTREQMATVLYRFAVLMGCDVEGYLDTNILSYEDAGDISDFAVEAMQWAVGAGIMSGYTDGSNCLGPQDDAERAHFAAMLMRMDALYGIL